jgi:hypothetical protein
MINFVKRRWVRAREIWATSHRATSEVPPPVDPVDKFVEIPPGLSSIADMGASMLG